MNQAEKSTSLGVVQVLLVTIAFIFLAWFAKYQGRRRRLDKLTAKTHGPPGYPVIGNIIDFLGDSSKGIFSTLVRYYNENPDLFKFWMGPNLIYCVSKPEYLEVILNHPDCLEKDGRYKYTKIYMGDGLFSAPVHIWRKHRKLINPAFNQKTLDSFVPIFGEQAKILVERLRKNSGRKNIDILHIISSCMLDTICETAMGIKVNAQTSSNHFGTVLEKLMEIVILRMANILYQIDFIFKWTKQCKSLPGIMSELQNFTGKVVIAKREIFERKMQALNNGEVIEEDNKYKTFLEILLQLSYADTKLTDKELQDEVNTVMAAGSDTTAAALCFALIMLGMFPEIQKKVYEEVIDILGENHDITHKDLPHLQYMERFLKETLRFFPIGAMFLRKATADIDIGDVFVPAHTSVFIFAYHLHRNPKYWKEPMKFDPDRFLPKEVAKRHPYSYLPFSGGSRGCIGSKYALMSMKSILAEVVRKVVVKTEYKSIEEVDLTLHLLLRPTHGFKISVDWRE